jgi:hypothetical protein
VFLRLVLASALFAAVAGIACAGGSGNGTKSVTGVVIDVQASSLTKLDGFTLHTDNDKTLKFKVAPDADRDPQNGFAAGHLRTHALGATKVRIFYREENGQLLAFRLEDILS